MLTKTKNLSAVILLACITYGCDNDSNTSTNDDTEIPVVTITPAETLEQILASGVNEDPPELNLTAIQTELNSLSGGSRNSEALAVTSGDTTTTLLTRAQGQ